MRNAIGLESEGQVFRDRFLIADIHMKSDFPTERWFWFDPPFHRNQSVLLHRQADDVWRIDFQLGWDADPEEEKKPERILPRLRAMLGPEAEFEIEWASVYTFQCRRMKSFRHGRVIFAGDAAHLVSPFGARGANSGFQDTDNLAWKLALVLAGRAPERLLDSYDAERTYAADENLRNSTRSTDFITPKSTASRTFRDAVLELAKRHPFARRLVNSGRLSVPAVLASSTLNTPDADADFAREPGAMIPGAPGGRCAGRGRGRRLAARLPARRLRAAGVRQCRAGGRCRSARAPRDPVPGGAGGRRRDAGRDAHRGPRRPGGAPLRRALRHGLPAASRPARRRALARVRSRARARGAGPRDVQRLTRQRWPLLNTEPNIAAPDDFYEALIGTHRGLSDEQSALVNAKLVLLLANHIGDRDVLSQALAAAREGVAGAA